jgi:hypothetical protein
MTAHKKLRRGDYTGSRTTTAIAPIKRFSEALPDFRRSLTVVCIGEALGTYLPRYPVCAYPKQSLRYAYLGYA